MRRVIRALAILAMGTVASAHDARAQWSHILMIEDDVLSQVMGIVTQSLIANQYCSIGEEAPWANVVEAVEGRYWACVKQDATWAMWAEAWKKDPEHPGQQDADPDKGIGILAFHYEIQKRVAKAASVGRAAYCSRSPWNLLLAPDKATTKQKADFTRANPDGKIEEALDLFSRVLALGRDAKWLEKPCSEGFWPSSYYSRK